LVKKIPTKLFKLLSASSHSIASREGLKEPISLEYILPHSGKEHDEIMAEVD
jgi:hypothetical protein